MAKQTKRKSTWEWYAVKVLFESIIVGQPNPDKIDKNYSTEIRSFEESIIIVKAQSFNQAYKLGEKKAKQAEFDYCNPYDEQVYFRFIDSIDCFTIKEDNLKPGTEVYSRIIQVPSEMKREEFIQRFFPEHTPEDEDSIGKMFRLRIKEFNKAPNSE